MLIAMVLALGTIPLSHASNPISRDGYYHGIFLGGKVKVVNYGASRMMSVNGNSSVTEKILPFST